MSDLWSRQLRGESMSPSVEYMSALLSEVSVCPNCRLLTFNASWHPFERLREAILTPTFDYPDRRTPKRFDMSGELCDEHWLTLYATASSAETSPPSAESPE